MTETDNDWKKEVDIATNRGPPRLTVKCPDCGTVQMNKELTDYVTCYRCGCSFSNTPKHQILV